MENVLGLEIGGTVTCQTPLARRHSQISSCICHSQPCEDQAAGDSLTSREEFYVDSHIA